MAKLKQEAQQPLILRAHRLMEAFAKSDSERDFYLDRVEGFIIYTDLDKSQAELENIEKEILENADRYCMIPKLTFYETKKIMEGFVNEKVYDIDTKEKLLDIIQSKEARANFLEFIYDHHAELEKWQQYYQERSRIRIIEWLRQNHFHFVFEEDLELSKTLLEKLKQNLFQTKVSQDVSATRKLLVIKAKTYYSNEALNPRPKRGRPPKQVAKLEIEPQLTTDIYLTVTPAVRPFLFTPDISSAAEVTFSTHFGSPELNVSKKAALFGDTDAMETLQQKLAALRSISRKWGVAEQDSMPSMEMEDDEDEEDDLDKKVKPSKETIKKPLNKAKLSQKTKPTASQKAKVEKAKPRKTTMRPVIKAGNKHTPAQTTGKARRKRIIPVPQPAIKSKPLAKAVSKAPLKSGKSSKPMALKKAVPAKARKR